MEWKTVKLGDIVQRKIGYGVVQPGDSPSVGIPVVKVKDVIAGLSSIDKLDKTTYEIAENYPRTQLHGGELVISLVGSVGKTTIVPKSFAGCNLVRATGMIDIANDVMTKWVKYYIDSPEGQNYIQMNLNTTVQATLNVKDLAAMEIPMPTTRDKIVAILSSLDAKIDNNNRINANLEAQAQALYKSWFVNFDPWGGIMPDDWKEVSLDDMTSKFGTGLNPRKNFKLGEGENFYVTIKNMADNRVYLDERCDKVTDEAIEKINKRSKLQAGDLLFSGIGTIGRVALVTDTPTNWNTSESVFNLHPAENISSEFLYVLLLSDTFQQYVKVYAQGGVQQGIRMASLKDYKMYLPDDKVLRQFDEQIIPIISRIKNFEKENDHLATLRDTLLPKLMKGEIEL